MGFVNSSRLAPILLLLPAAFAQSNAILTVAQPEKLVAKRNTEITARIDVSIAEGYHINSNAPHEVYLIPLRLTWTPEPLSVETVIFPKPRDEKYQFSDQPLSVFTGNFAIATKFKVPAAALSGPAILAGKLRYQACNSNMCFPPKTVELKLPIEVR